MQAVGRQIGLQARAAGCSQAMSPVLQVATDPRWGRLSENFGEDRGLLTQGVPGVLQDPFAPRRGPLGTLCI